MNTSVYKMPPNRPVVHPSNREDVSTDVDVQNVSPLIVDKSTECFVTPQHVAELMVDYAGDFSGVTLEPSAGTGNLIRAMLNADYPANGITAVERDVALFNVLCDSFDSIDIINQCFLNYADSTAMRYQTILVNPPFKQVKQHIQACYDLLHDGGSVIALVPQSFKHDNAEFLQDLPIDTFQGIKVNTKLIRLEK